MTVHFSVYCGDDFYRPLCGEYAVYESASDFEQVTCDLCRKKHLDHESSKSFPEIEEICEAADELKALARSGHGPTRLRAQIGEIALRIEALGNMRRDLTAKILTESKKP